MSINYYLSVEKNNGDSWDALDLYTKDGTTNHIMLPQWLGRKFFSEDSSEKLLYVDPHARGLPRDMSESFIVSWGVEDKYNYYYYTWYDYIELLYLCNIEDYAAAAETLKTIIDMVLDIYDIYAYRPNQVRFIIAQG